jgi:hypothetical protein
LPGGTPANLNPPSAVTVARLNISNMKPCGLFATSWAEIVFGLAPSGIPTVPSTFAVGTSDSGKSMPARSSLAATVMAVACGALNVPG